MKNRYMKQGVPLFISGIFLTMVLSCNSTNNDKELQNNIAKELQSNQSYKEVHAQVTDGAVTLTGTCDGGDCVTQVENKVKSMNGVKTVDNKIQKSEPISHFDLLFNQLPLNIRACRPMWQQELLYSGDPLKGTSFNH